MFSHKAILVVSTILNVHVHLSFAPGFQHCFWSSIRNILAKYHKPHWLVASFISFRSDHVSLSSLGHITQTTPLISIFTGYFLSCVSIIFRQSCLWSLASTCITCIVLIIQALIMARIWPFLACYQHFIWSTSNLVMNFIKVLVFLFSFFKFKLSSSLQLEFEGMLKISKPNS